MPFESSQISGLIGGQQAMFFNNANFSQQVGATYGMNQPPSGTMSNPFPSYAVSGWGGQLGGQPGATGLGTSLAGSAAMSIPAMSTGVSLAGGLLGGAAGWADPFTGVARAFRMGSGAARGAGVFGTLGHIGSTGVGSLAGGLAAGAAMAVPYVVAGAAIQKGAESIYQGVQNVSDVGRLAQDWGPAYGTPGMRPGGQLPRQQIKDIVDTLENLADQSVIHNVENLKRLVGKFNQMGMMTGVIDAQSFKQKFGQMLTQVDSIAKVMGTSLEEAAPILQGMRQMGMWRAQDIMPTALSMQIAGKQAQPNLMGAMQTGARVSWQQGGTLTAGATMGRQQFMQVQAMMRSGAMDEQQLMEMTGGVGGTEGMQMLAEQNAMMQSSLARTPMGRAMMAGLGEVRNDRFTGGVDMNRMKQFMSGGIDIDQLLGRGRGVVNKSRGGAASFVANQEQMGQEIMAGMGPAGYAQMIEQMMQRSGFDSGDEDIRKVFMQRTMGLGERQAKYFSDLMNRLPEIQEAQSRQALDAINDYYDRMDRRMNRSWGALGDKLKNEWEKSWRPFRDLGAGMSTAGDQAVDEFTNRIMGRTNRIRMSSERMSRVISRSAEGDLTRASRESGGMNTLDIAPSLAEGIAAEFGAPTRQSGAKFLGQELVATEGDRGAGAPEAGMIQVGRTESVFGMNQARKYWSRSADVEKAARRAVARGQGEFGFSDKDKANLDIVRRGLSDLVRNPREANKLRYLKKTLGDDAGLYSSAAFEILEKGSSDEVRRAIRALHESKSATNPTDVGINKHDIMAAIGVGSNIPLDMKVDFGAMAGQADWVGLASLDINSKEFKEREQAILTEARDALRGDYGGDVVMNTGNAVMRTLTAAGSAALGASTGAIEGLLGRSSAPLGNIPILGMFTGSMSGMGKGAITGWGVGGKYFSESKMTDTDLMTMVTNDKYGDAVVQYANGNKDPLIDLASSDPGAKDALDRLQKIESRGEDSPGWQRVKKALGGEKGVRFLEYAKTAKIIGAQTGELAQKTLKDLQGTTAKEMGVSEGVLEAFKNVVRKQASGKYEDVAAGGGMARELARHIERPEAEQLGKVGGLFGRQVLGFDLMEDLGKGEMSEKQAGAWRKKLERTLGKGVISGDIEQDLSKMVEDKKFSVEEQKDFQKKLSDRVAASGVAGGKGGAQGLMEQLTQYTSANKQFVQAVGTALMGLVDEKTKVEIGKKYMVVSNANIDTGGQKPAGAGETP